MGHMQAGQGGYGTSDKGGGIVPRQGEGERRAGGSQRLPLVLIHRRRPELA